MAIRYTEEVCREAFRLHNLGETWNDIAAKLTEVLGWKVNPDALRKRHKAQQSGTLPTVVETVAEHISSYRAKSEERADRKRVHQLTEELERREREWEAALRLKDNLSPAPIQKVHDTPLEATAFIVASDWHIEEIVKASTVNGRNEFNLDIADKRIAHFFHNAIRLVKVSEQNTKLTKIVLVLNGDFISGNIHEELLENTALLPIDAILWVQQRLIGGIQLILKETKLPLTIVCKCGNHTRITKKVHVSTEAGNSLEYMMYHTLRLVITDPRVEWVIEEGYFTFLDVYGYTIRVHHGHDLQYGGGVGGLTIPVKKAIAQWNKARWAHLDIFGHWHQQFNGGDFICNGSLIGYNPYAIKIKASYEPPAQKFFMYTSTGRVVGEYPIFLE
jgi:hypothetical protein